jgi:hypothetical protein
MYEAFTEPHALVAGIGLITLGGTWLKGCGRAKEPLTSMQRSVIIA